MRLCIENLRHHWTINRAFRHLHDRAAERNIFDMYCKSLALLAAAALPLCGAGDAALDRATLRGIAAVNLVIDPVAEDLNKEGATADALLTRLEDKLREAGIKVDKNASEFVALRLTSVHGTRGRFNVGNPPYAVAATIGLYQPVMLVRDRNVKTATQTWEVETITLADAKQVYRASMDSVDELAGRFVTAWRSVNPGGPTGPPH
jgi:hypothetical protein